MRNMVTILDQGIGRTITINESEVWFHRLSIKEREDHMKRFNRFVSHITYALNRKMNKEFTKKQYDTYIDDVLTMEGIDV